IRRRRRASRCWSTRRPTRGCARAGAVPTLRVRCPTTPGAIPTPIPIRAPVTRPLPFTARAIPPTRASRARAWASTRRGDRPVMRPPGMPGSGDGGFTLIEVLVVLLIVAVIGTLAYTYVMPLYARARVAYQRDDLERQLLELPQRVRSSGHGGI